MTPRKSPDGFAAQLKKLEAQVTKLGKRLESGDLCVQGTIRRTCGSAGKGEPILAGESVYICPKGKRPKRR
jgi:hypothetical protein